MATATGSIKGKTVRINGCVAAAQAEPCIARSDRSNGLYKILVDYCKGCRVCIEECPTGCLEGVPELDLDTGVVRMDTAFAITPGLHGRQAQELVNMASRPAKEV